MSVYYHLKTGEYANLAFVAHVNGFPYAMADRQDVITALASDTTRRRTMFESKGFTPETGGGDQYPADDMPIFNVLQRIGGQKIRMHDGKGMLEGGDFDITVSREPIGYNWTGSPTHWSGDIWGLPGIHTIPDGRIDSSIGWGTLSRHLDFDAPGGGGSDHIWIDRDEGGKIQTLIDALGAGEYLLLWVGGECIAVDDYDNSNDPEIMLEIATTNAVARGLYRSKRQAFWHDDDTSNIIVATAPVGGCTNRPINIWALAMTNSGAITGDPVLVQFGRISQSIQADNGLIKLSCQPWWSWLDTDIPIKHLYGQLKGYCFSRTQDPSGLSDYGDQCPHMVIREYDGVDWQTRAIWLCADPGNNSTNGVYYETATDLREAIQSELDAASTYGGKANISANGSDDLSHVYIIGINGRLYCESYTLTTPLDPIWEQRFMCSGAVPWALGIGAVHKEEEGNIREEILTNYYSFDYKRDTHAFYNNDEAYTKSAWRFILHKGNSEFDYSDVPELKHHGDLERCEYFYQWRRHGQTILEELVEPRNDWPIPIDDSDNCRLYLREDVDATDFDASLELLVGTENYELNEQPTLSDGSFSATGDNWLQMDATFAYHDIGYNNNLPALAHVGGRIGPFRDLHSLFYCPLYHEADPWPVAQRLNLRKSYIRKLFRALLGAHTGSRYTIPERYMIQHIPGAADDNFSDMHEIIDWDDFDSKVRDVDFDIRYVVGFEDDEELNILDLFKNTLLFFGLMPTWEWDDAHDSYIMRFERMGIINTSKAITEGRKIDTSNLAMYGKITMAHSGTWLFNKVSCKCNYDSKEGKYQAEINVDSNMGWAIQGGKKSTLKISNKLLEIIGVEQIETNRDLRDRVSRHFAQCILQNLIYVMPEIKCTLALNTALTHNIGTNCVITLGEIYNPYTGELGMTDQPALIVGQNINWSKGIVDLILRITPNGVYGWSPAVRIPANSSSVAGSVVTVTDTGQYDFSDPNGRSDLSYFDCLDWNRTSRNYDARDCSCTDYKVLAFEENNADPTIMEFTIGTITLDDSTPAYSCKLTGADAASWDTTKDNIIIFADWDDADLQDCQRHYLYGADQNNELDDGSSKTPGRKWT